MNPRRHTDPLLVLFITLSFLLHLVIFLLAPRQVFAPTPMPKRPVTVELRPQVPKPRETELPPQPLPPPVPRTKPARRLAPQDRQVVRETAPQGQDQEDLTPSAPAHRLSPPTAPAAPAPTAAVTQAEPTGILPPQPAPPASLPGPSPSLQSLLTLPKSTTDRLVDEMRRKHRDDVASGNAVWLDTEQDLLSSFFKRFKDGIYRVWNYPPRAAERGEEGVCLLKITIARDGTVKHVEILDPSGSPLLDNEALAAVRRAGPYGDLPRSYTEEELNIFAFFRYTLMRQHRSIL